MREYMDTFQAASAAFPQHRRRFHSIGKREAGLSTTEFAHPMRNMLTAMLGNLEQLRRQPLDQQGCHQLARATAYRRL